MSRPGIRRPVRAIDRSDPELSALRAELEVRLDQLRATIEAKRLVGWTLVRCSRPALDETA